MAKVAFLGLGVMGFPMAGHLAAKGHDVVVYNRTFSKAEAWTKKHKGSAAKTPKEAAAGREHHALRHAEPHLARSQVGNEDHEPSDQRCGLVKVVGAGGNGAGSGGAPVGQPAHVVAGRQQCVGDVAAGVAEWAGDHMGRHGLRRVWRWAAVGRYGYGVMLP